MWKLLLAFEISEEVTDQARPRECYRRSIALSKFLLAFESYQEVRHREREYTKEKVK